MLPYSKNVVAYTGGDLMAPIFQALCEGIDSPTSLSCWLQYKYGEHYDLASRKVDPSNYTRASDFRDDYLVVSYLSKYKGLKTGLDVKAEALSSFEAAEAKCKETNARLRQMRPADCRVEPVLFLATMKIASILGECNVPSVLAACRWSGGATATLREAEANAIRKMDESPISVTRGALDLLKREIESDYLWCSGICKADVEGPLCLLDTTFNIIETNRVTTVPKDATKDRTIAAEPTGNVFLQLGVGKYIRARLKKRVGIDLDSQEFNQRAALEGSISGQLATVDLKSASDTVSRQLVLQLLPWDWFELLDQLRSREGIVGDRVITYEKFSSMGNGYTFELETLLFYSLAWACAQLDCPEGPTLVYGDDIICHTDAYPRLLEVLTYCGFSVNTKKTHASGSFRESCGKHYWDGSDVTPIYQKELLHGNRLISRGEVYRCANRIIRLAWRRGHFLWLDSKLKRAWRTARRIVTTLHVVPLHCVDDDGLALPKAELDHYVIGKVRHGLLTLPVLSFVPRRREIPPFYQRTALADRKSVV